MLQHRHLEHVKLRVLWLEKTLALAGDERLLKHQTRFGIAFDAPKYYRSKTLQPPQIDNLYTELVLLPV